MSCKMAYLMTISIFSRASLIFSPLVWYTNTHPASPLLLLVCQILILPDTQIPTAALSVMRAQRSIFHSSTLGFFPSYGVAHSDAPRLHLHAIAAPEAPVEDIGFISSSPPHHIYTRPQARRLPTRACRLGCAGLNARRLLLFIYTMATAWGYPHLFSLLAYISGRIFLAIYYHSIVCYFICSLWLISFSLRSLLFIWPFTLLDMCLSHF